MSADVSKDKNEFIDPSADKAKLALAGDVLEIWEGKSLPPAAPKETEQSLDFNGTSLTVKSRDGKPYYFKEGTTEWDSKDGKLWIRRGTDGLGTWRGNIGFNEKGDHVEDGTPYGVSVVRTKDGKEVTSVKNKDGVDLVHTKNKDGSFEFTGTSGTWTSKDGKVWKNGDKEYKGQLSIDAYGRFWRKADTAANWEVADRSAESAKISEKMTALEKKYNVSFGAGGKEVEYEYKDPEVDKYVKTQVPYRMPTLSELKVIEGCLDQYAHLAATTDGFDFKGLRFNFVDGSGNGPKVSLYGWYNAQKEGVSQISFGPRNTLSGDETWDGLKGTALHEIAHHLQSQLWTERGTRVTPQKVLDAFNFSLDKTSGNYRLTDKDGKIWERHENRVKNKDSGKWEYQGRWYPVVGGTTIKEEGRSRTNTQMRDNMPADKKPCTNYFTYPTEAHAESLSMYLFDRRLLFEKNKALYESQKSWDQEDLNRRYGLDQAGVPKALRGADGSVVPNNAENRKKVSDMEEGWKKKPASKAELRTWERAITNRDSARGLHCEDKYKDLRHESLDFNAPIYV